MDKPFTLGGKEIYLADLEVGELINIMNNIVVAIAEGNEELSAEQLVQIIHTNAGLIPTSEQKFIYYHWLVLELSKIQSFQTQGRLFSDRGFWRAISNSMYKAFDYKQPVLTGELDLTEEEVLRLEYLQQELQKNHNVQIRSLRKRDLISARLFNVLARVRIWNLEDLNRFTRLFLNTPGTLNNFGSGTLTELKLIMLAAGIELDEDADPNQDLRLSVAVSHGRLSSTTANDLFRSEIYYVGDLAKYTATEMKGLMNSPSHMPALIKLMQKHGFQFKPEYSAES